MKEEMIFTKKELLQFLNDHKIHSIRIVAETSVGTNEDPTQKLTMLDICSSKKEEPVYKNNWYSTIAGSTGDTTAFNKNQFLIT